MNLKYDVKVNYSIHMDVLERFKHIKDGKLNGENKTWYSFGKLDIHSYYKNGKINGFCNIYDGDGKIIKCLKYKDGTLVKEVLYDN